MRKLISLIILSTLFLSGCKTSTEPVPPEKKPPGYQEDVPWPSLADSPWPMYRGSPQSTGRSKGLGAVFGTLEWEVDSFYVSTGIAISDDSTIYIGISSPMPDVITGIAALYQNGKTKWIYQFDSFFGQSSPLIASDGTIYISGWKNLFAITPNGQLKWKTKDEINIEQSGISLGRDGTIYSLGYENNEFILFAINKDGEILWKLFNDDFHGAELEGMSFSPDGNILYIPGSSNGKTIYAVDINSRTIKWSFGNDRIFSGYSIVDCNGYVYVISKGNDNKGYLYSLNDSGNVRWKYLLSDLENSWSLISNYNSFAMDKFGNIYTGLRKLYCIDYLGNLKWTYPKDSDINISSPIVVDGNNNIYFSIGVDEEKKIVCVDSTGNLCWQLSYPDNFYHSNYSFGLGFNKLYVPGYKTNVLSSIK